MNIFPEESEFERRHFERATPAVFGRLDDLAKMLGYTAAYFGSKRSRLWPKLSAHAVRAYLGVNHKSQPQVGNRIEMQAEHIAIQCWREGQSRGLEEQGRLQTRAFTTALRNAGRRDLANQIANAAKNHPKRAEGSSLKELLAMLWLPAMLWTLNDQGVADAFPNLRGKNGEKIAGMPKPTERAIADARRDLRLPSFREWYHEPLATFEPTLGFAWGFGCDFDPSRPDI